MSKIEALADSVSGTIKAYIGERFKSFEAGITETVRKMVEALPKPKDGVDGKDGDPGKTGADGINGKDGAPGISGKDADPEVLVRMVKEAMALVPNPRDGIDGKDGAPGLNGKDGADGIHGKDGADGIHGKDFDPVVLRAECLLAARAAVADLPPAPAGKDADPAQIADAVYERLMKSIRLPEDGKSVTVEDVKPLLEGEVSRWELDFERRAADVLQRAVDRLPKPKNGIDGFNVEDLSLSMKGDRTLVFSFSRSDGSVIEKEWTIPGVPVYKGTYRAGLYEKGDMMTFGGSVWIAKRDTETAPPGDDWQMAVKGTR